MPKRGSKRTITPLERGLAISAWKEGQHIRDIALALLRAEKTISRILTKAKAHARHKPIPPQGPRGCGTTIE